MIRYIPARRNTYSYVPYHYPQTYLGRQMEEKFLSCLPRDSEPNLAELQLVIRAQVTMWVSNGNSYLEERLQVTIAGENF